MREFLTSLMEMIAEFLASSSEAKKKKENKVVFISKMPIYGEQKKEHVKTYQQALVRNGADIEDDGNFGPKTKSATSVFQKSKGLAGSGKPGLKTIKLLGLAIKKKEPASPAPVGRKTPSWFLKAKTWSGKHETRDKKWAAWMASQWKHLGLDLPHISKSWSAWCGLAVAVSLMGVGLDYQKNGAAAKNWLKYGQNINWRVDGIPQGAIVQINHNGQSGCGKSKGNHVAFANGDCSARYLLVNKSTIDLYGGNQGNSWKVSTYPVWKICGVKWPKDAKDEPWPGKIIEMKKCSSGAYKWESTR